MVGEETTLPAEFARTNPSLIEIHPTAEDVSSSLAIVAVMEPTDHRLGDNRTAVKRLYLTRNRRVLPKTEMSSRLVVVLEVFA